MMPPSYFYRRRIAEDVRFSELRRSDEDAMRMIFMRRRLFALLAAAAIIGPATAEEGPLPKEFEAIETIVVVFLENRSFVNLLPSFPGALGIAQSPPESILQRDRDGSVLLHLPPVWKNGSTTPDPAYPTSMQNVPFAIDEPPYDLPRSVLTVSPVHRFYQNRMQINDGKNDMFVAWTDVGSLVMGHYNPEGSYLYKLAKEFTLADQFFMAAFGGSNLNHLARLCLLASLQRRADEHARRTRRRGQSEACAGVAEVRARRAADLGP